MIFLDLIYAVTFMFKSFRLIITFIIYYDLKYKQFDIINTFLNVRLKEYIEVYYELLNGFKKLNVCVKLNKALYKLKESLTL